MITKEQIIDFFKNDKQLHEDNCLNREMTLSACLFPAEKTDTNTMLRLINFKDCDNKLNAGIVIYLKYNEKGNNTYKIAYKIYFENKVSEGAEKAKKIINKFREKNIEISKDDIEETDISKKASEDKIVGILCTLKVGLNNEIDLLKQNLRERFCILYNSLYESGFKPVESKKYHTASNPVVENSMSYDLANALVTDNLETTPNEEAMKEIPLVDYAPEIASPDDETLPPVLFWVTTVGELFKREAISLQQTISLADGKKISKIRPGKYVIPNYQRKYAWQSRQINQLCRDLLRASDENSENAYHLGTLIFHRENEYFYVVDGQQRLTTISILLKQKVFYEDKKSSGHLCEQQFTDKDRECIKGVFQYYSEEEQQKIKKTLEQCTFICISVKDITESFQLFSTQNGRGRPLTPANLLKAYHFHEINKLSDPHLKLPEEKCNKIDTEWENFNMENLGDGVKLLSQVIGEHLFRLRNWCRGEFLDKVFSGNDIGEFKGLTPDSNATEKVPLQNLAVLRHYANASIHDAKCKSEIVPNELLVNRTQNDEMEYYMSIDQPIINGEDFFKYALSYAKAYKILFGKKPEDDVNDVKDFKNFYKDYCEYGGFKRRGDTYARHVFESLCLFCFDRFGAKGLIRCQQELYCCAYFERLVNFRCYYSTCGGKYAIRAIRCMLRSTTLPELKERLRDLRLDIISEESVKNQQNSKNKQVNGIDVIMSRFH